MPGSPPISVAEPATNPPPATRSSSAIPVTRRGSVFVAPDRSSSGNGRPAAPRRAVAPPTPSAAASSMIVFHSPHEFALALPPLSDGAAILADIRRTKLGHGADSQVCGGVSRGFVGLPRRVGRQGLPRRSTSLVHSVIGAPLAVLGQRYRLDQAGFGVQVRLAFWTRVCEENQLSHHGSETTLTGFPSRSGVRTWP